MNDPGEHRYRFGAFLLDSAEQILLRDGVPVPLKPKVFRLLTLLVENSGHVLNRDDLIRALWPDHFVEEGNLTVTVSNLRKALGDNSIKPRYIATVPSRGYRFVASVQTDFHAEAKTKAPQRETEATPSTPAIRSQRRKIVTVLTAGMAVLVLLLGLKLLVWRPLSASSAAPFRRPLITRITDSGNIRDAAISPDGKYVVYVKEEAAQQSIWARKVNTTNAVQIVPFAVAEYWGLTFSPDSNHVYYLKVGETGTNKVYRVAVLGGVPNEVTSDSVSPVSLSPDGSKLTFVRSDLNKRATELVVANIDGTGERTLGLRQSPKFFGNDRPSWSPDGKLIACAVGDNTALGKMNIVGFLLVDGTEQQIMSPYLSVIRSLAWLPDGKGLVVVASDSVSTTSRQIWHLSYPDGQIERITNDLSSYLNVSVTQDSSALVTVQRDLVSGVETVSAIGASDTKQITSGRSDSDDSVTWMPDGRVLYTSNLSGNRDIWMMNGDGTGSRQLTRDSGSNLFPVASPDGNTIVYVSYRDGKPHIWRMAPDGNGQQQLTDDSGETAPRISPDGKFVVYMVLGSANSGLWRIPISGGTSVKLADSSFRMPSISPDGQKIACYFLDKQSKARWRIAIISSTDGSPISVLDMPSTIDPRKITPLVWTLDGKALAYIDNRAGGSAIRSLSLEEGKPQQLATFPGEELLWFDWSRDRQRFLILQGKRVSDAVMIRVGN